MAAASPPWPRTGLGPGRVKSAQMPTLQADMVQPSPFPTVDAFLDALWLEDGLAGNTLAPYRRDLTAFGHWLHTEQGRTPEAALREDIQAWLAAQHRQTKASTANRRLAALRRFFLW